MARVNAHTERNSGDQSLRSGDTQIEEIGRNGAYRENALGRNFSTGLDSVGDAIPADVFDRR
ncbi:MAG: hypothetical protein ABSG51_14925, partial [Terracidiphilus sp.]